MGWRHHAHSCSDSSSKESSDLCGDSMCRCLVDWRHGQDSRRFSGFGVSIITLMDLGLQGGREAEKLEGFRF